MGRTHKAMSQLHIVDGAYALGDELSYSKIFGRARSHQPISTPHNTDCNSYTHLVISRLDATDRAYALGDGSTGYNRWSIRVGQ